MGEREAFGPNLRRVRVQRGISLDQIAAATKVSPDLWSGLERNDFSRWPTGIYARAYVRAYALQLGVDAETAVDDFCRFFPQGDRRVARVVREQAALVGHQSTWKDELTGAVKRNRRAIVEAEEEPPVIGFTRTGRIIGSIVDTVAVLGLAAGIASILPVGWAGSLAFVALAYHAVSLVTLGCTPSVWLLDTYLANRHPAAHRATQPRFLRLLRGSRT
jgi:transcriptional regulator with XRE-family HTH domain